ncbi:MAG: hypothetical protein Q4B28_07585 [bacterium]|nr:hypothetical protein [bacterium]
MIYFTPYDSKLPPYDLGSREWVRMEITGVDRDNGSFTAKTYGTELKLHPEDEGKEQEYQFSDF